MMPHRAVAIANEFLQIPGANEVITQMQLQKLVYFAHGWNLVINREPLVPESAEAWEYGPVYRDLYDHTKFFGKEPIGRLITSDDREMARFFLGSKKGKGTPYRASLSERERAVIQHVWMRYGRLSAVRLSELTHQRGAPWFETYKLRGRNSVIDDKLTEGHYGSLARRAEAAIQA